MILDFWAWFFASFSSSASFSSLALGTVGGGAAPCPRPRRLDEGCAERRVERLGMWGADMVVMLEGAGSFCL